MRIIHIAFDNEKPFLVKPTCDQTILGHAGEAGAVQLHLDVSPISAIYPEAQYSLFVQLSDGLEIAPMISQLAHDGVITWTVHESVLLKPGNVQMVLVVQQRDITAKTYAWTLCVEDSILGRDDLPDPLESYLTLIQEATAGAFAFQAALEHMDITTETLPPGEPASASGSLDANNGLMLHFKIPQGVDGADGGDGRDIELRASESHLQWRYVGADAWNDLLELSVIVGKDGANGQNGRDGEDGLNGRDGIDGKDGKDGTPGRDGYDVELSSDATHIMWKHTHETEWKALVDLAELHGKDGINGSNGRDGRAIELSASPTHIQWRYAGDENAYDLVSLSQLSGKDGADGREIELQASATHIQWRFSGDEAWIDVIDLSALRGGDGKDGRDGLPGTDGTDGREITLRTAEAYIQWQHAGDTTWRNVIDLSSLRGGTFTPTITEAGELSWANDLGLANPTPISVIGPEGKPGSDAAVPSWVGSTKPSYSADEIVSSGRSNVQEKLDGLRGDLTTTSGTLTNHVQDNVRHVTTADRSAWDGKAASTHSHTLANLPIIVSTTDLEPGVSPLPTGTIYFVYE